MAVRPNSVCPADDAAVYPVVRRGVPRGVLGVYRGVYTRTGTALGTGISKRLPKTWGPGKKSRKVSENR